MKNVLLIGILLNCSVCCFSQNSFNDFTDDELIKLAQHIKSLETKSLNFMSFNKLYSSANKNDISGTKQKNSQKGFTDAEVITLANYVKALEAALQNMSVTDETYNQTLAEIQTVRSLYGLPKEN